MTQYRYKRLGQVFLYDLAEDVLVIDARTLFKSERRPVALDQIPRWSRTVTMSRKSLFYVAVVGVLLFVAFSLEGIASPAWLDGSLVSLMVATLAGTLWFRGRRYMTVFTPPHEAPFAVFAPRHPWPELDRFLQALESAKLKAVESKLGVMAASRTSNEMNDYLLWLRDNGIVDNIGLEYLQAWIAGKARRGPAGFGPHSSDETLQH